MPRTLTFIALLAVTMIAQACGRGGGDGEGTSTDGGSKPIFDGKSLEGWISPDMSFRRVEDGAITGEVTADRKPPENDARPRVCEFGSA